MKESLFASEVDRAGFQLIFILAQDQQAADNVALRPDCRR